TAFGFTEDELKSLLEDNDLTDHYDDVASWYNGYNFGGEVIYNPWSVMSYASRKAKKPKAFWVNTANTEIIDKLVIREGKEFRKELWQLLEGKTIKKPVYENIGIIDMKNLEIQDDLLWSLLLFSGYLKPVEEVGDETYTLKIPNREVTKIYHGLIKTWFEEEIGPNLQEKMVEALEAGDVERFERELREVVTRVMSYHDFSGAPEKVYHALMIGMLAWCSYKYDIRSNRESGYGRYDLVLQPKDIKNQGIIMEFKRIDEKRESGKARKRESGKAEGAPEKTLNEALAQIEARQYETEMVAAGVKDILKLAIAFKGKELWVRGSGNR
ncbi:MAG: AAA family ATPase, partial [Proteobacteria bacterium]|nr:AAA family ATPase [Pseudomonadota bacterium]